MIDRPKATAVEGGYVGQGWYVDLAGEIADRRGNGVSRKIAVEAARLWNAGYADSISEALHIAQSGSYEIPIL